MGIDNYEIIATANAKEDLEKIYKYISQKLLEPTIADKLVKKIKQKILNLEKNPYICTEVQIKPHNDVYRKLVIDNYIALYEVNEEDKKVIVYDIIYNRMDYLNY